MRNECFSRNNGCIFRYVSGLKYIATHTERKKERERERRREAGREAGRETGREREREREREIMCKLCIYTHG